MAAADHHHVVRAAHRANLVTRGPKSGTRRARNIQSSTTVDRVTTRGGPDARHHRRRPDRPRPRLRAPGLGDQPRPVWQVTHRARRASRARASRSAAPSPASTWRHLDPFIMMDQMGEVEYAPGEPKGTPWHPHRGFETVTYIIDGVFDHQDSHGGGGTHHQRRHPVDDRRLRAAPHRGAAGVAGRRRAACSTASSSG